MPLNLSIVRRAGAGQRGDVGARADHQAVDPEGDGEDGAQTLRPLKSDRQKVKQIVLNLLSNALKFTPTGAVTISASYDEHEALGRHFGSGHRRRNRARRSGESIRGFPPARLVADARLWRHRPRAVDLPPSRADAGRHHRADQRHSTRARPSYSSCRRGCGAGSGIRMDTPTILSRSCWSWRTIRTPARCTRRTCRSPAIGSPKRPTASKPSRRRSS